MVKITQMKKTTLRQAALRLALVALAVLSPLGLRAQETLPLYETASDQNQYVPFYGYYGDEVQTNQLIYPASELSDMDGGEITQMVFYVASQSGSYTLCDWVVSIGETSATTLSGIDNTTTLTQVYSGAMTFGASSGATTMTIVFDQPYTYNGGNLLIQFNNPVTNSSAYHRYYFTGIEATGASYCYGDQQDFLPKVTFTYEPAQQGGDVCEKPSTCEVSDITATSATLTWDGGSGHYNVEVKGGSYADWTTLLSNTNLTTTTLTLSPTTSYQARVQSVCDGSTPTSAWKTSASFTTPCGAEPLNYVYGFEEVAPFSCWTAISGTVTRMSGTTHAGSYRLDFRGTTSNMIAFPPIDAATNTLRVEFWTRPESTGGSSGKFAIGYMTDINDANTFVAVETYNSTAMTTSYVKKTVDLVSAPANAFIVFRQFDCSTNYYWYVDDVVVKPMPSCVAPTALNADPSTNSADLSWTANSGETAWTLYYKKTSDENYTEVTNVTENPYTLPGLTAATNYQFYVVANCSSTDNSEASDVKVFATECEAISAEGYSINFDDYEVASSYTAPTTRVLPNCWNAINTTTYSSYTQLPSIYYYSSTNYAHSTPNCLKFYSYAYYSGGSTTYDPQPQYAIMPEMYDLAGKQITLWARGYNTSSTFKVGTMSDPTDASTFTEITGSIDNPAAMTTSYQEYIFYIPSNTIDRYVAIMIEAANSTRTTIGVYIDDIEFSVAPTCWQPQNLTASDVTNESATLTWNRHAMGDETAWVLQYGTDENFGDGTYTEVTPSTNPTYTIENGLAATTTYYVRVKPACDNDGELWSETINFTTKANCMVPDELAISDITAHTASLNWTGNNDSYNLRYRKAITVPVNFDETYDFEDNSLQGWTTLSNDGDSYKWSIQSGSSNSHQGNYCVRSRYTSSGVPNDWLISPEIPLGGTLSFYAKRYSTSYTDQFQVFISTTGNNISDFTAISEVITPNTTYDLYEYDLSAYSGNGYVAIVYTGLEDQYYVYVDDIHITASIPGVYDEWQTVENAAKPYPFSNLDADSYYEAQVNGHCNSGDITTDWSEAISFKTTIACPAPTTLAVAANTDDATTRENLTWVMNGAETDWQICVNNDMDNLIPVNVSAVVITDDVVSYTLMGLIPGQDYTVKVRANCELSVPGDATSEWSNTANFQTEATCTEPTAFAHGTVDAHSAVLTWTKGGTETQWQLCVNNDMDNLILLSATDDDVNVDEQNVSYTLTGLTATTEYTVKVRAYCADGDGNQSPWTAATTFTTECDAVTTFPWSENFESYAVGNFSDQCWINEHIAGTASYVFNVSTDPNGSNTTHQLKLPDQSNGNMTKLRLPEMTLPNNNYQFVIDVYRSTYSTLKEGEGVRVYASTDGEIEGATELAFIPRDYAVSSDVISSEATVGWYTYELPIQMSGTCYIILRGESQYGKATYMDNFRVELVPACRKPKDFALDSKTAHTATMSWTNGTASQTAWQIAYSTDENFAPANDYITPGENEWLEDVTDNPAQISNLTHNTTYYAYVRANCGTDGYSDWCVNTITFATDNATVAPTNLAANGISSVDATISWTGATATNDHHESYELYYSTADVAPTATPEAGDNYITGITATSQLLDELDPSTEYNVWVRDNCGIDGKSAWTGMTFTTLAACPNPTNLTVEAVTAYEATVAWDGNTENDSYMLKYRKATTAPVDFDETYDFEDGSMQGWTTYDEDGDGSSWSINSSSSTAHGGSRYLTAQYNSSAVPNDWLISPEIALGGTLSFYAKKSSGTEQFQVYVSTTGTEISNFTAISEVIDATTTYTLYQYDLSSYSGNGYVAIKHTGAVDQYWFYIDDITYTNNIPGVYEEWQTVNNATSPATIEDLDPESYYEVQVFGVCSGTPETIGSNIANFTTDPSCLAPTALTVNGWGNTYADLSWTRNSEDETSWQICLNGDEENLIDVTTGYTTSGNTVSYLMPENTLTPETDYTVKVRTYCSVSDQSAWSNEESFTTLVACPVPTNLEANNMTTTSADLSWTAGLNETEWTIYYKKTADEEYTAVTGVTVNPYTLPGLEASTQYVFYVTANCSATEESAASTTYTFYTACDAITSFPWSEDFNSYANGVFSDPCWVNEHISGVGTDIFKITSTSYGGNNTKKIQLPDMESGTLTKLRLPEMNLPNDSYQFVIDVYRSNSTYNNDYPYEGIRVYASTNGEIEGATELTFIPRQYNVSSALIPAETAIGWYTYEIPIGISGNCYIILRGESQYCTSTYVDNFKVRLPEFNDTLNGNSWYAISSPVSTPVVTSVDNLIATGTEKYDFFRYNETNATWENYKVHDFDFENGRGYIYRRTNDATLTFTGTPNNGNDIPVNLSYTEAMDEHLKGFNLIGNPYTTEYALGRECYSLNTNGTWAAQTSSYLVQPFEAVMVQADEAGTYTFTNGSSKDAPKAVEALAIKVNGNGFEDVTYAMLENGKGLNKINHLAEEAPALSIAANGSNYAIAYLGYEVESFPLTLNAQAGTYTIALNSQISSLSYVHLIDNLTGKDIDLLSNVYTFTTDGNSANRFLVKLSPSSLQATEGEIATWNGNSWTVKGEGTLQLFDVMGRKVLSQEVSELSTINTDHLSSGVYVIRLGEKSQKIVVK